MKQAEGSLELRRDIYSVNFHLVGHFASPAAEKGMLCINAGILHVMVPGCLQLCNCNQNECSQLEHWWA